MNAKMLQFTVEETNLIGIYHMPSRLETILELERIKNRLADPIMQQVVKQAMVKLAEISDEDFDTWDWCVIGEEEKPGRRTMVSLLPGFFALVSGACVEGGAPAPMFEQYAFFNQFFDGAFHRGFANSGAQFDQIHFGEFPQFSLHSLSHDF